jgi:hypothetical protein
MRPIRVPRFAPNGKAIAASAVVVIGLLIVAVPFFSGWKATPVDKIGLHYSGGPIEGQKFQKIIEPGSGNRFLGLADKLVLLPVTQRDYTASSDDGSDGGPIVAPARGGVEMQFEVGAYFTLNTSPDVVRRFYERVCIKFGCTSDDGWDEMLKTNFRRPIEQAIQQSIREFTVNELYAGSADGAVETEDQATAILEQVQDQVAADLKENINRVLGGDYFCGPTFDRSEPDDCPDFEFQITSAIPTSETVRAAFAENAASQQKVVTAQNNAAAAEAEAQGQARAQAALNGLYTDPGYIAYLNALALQECAKNSNCTIVAGADGVNVNANAAR